jgi:transposase-like protein/ribosomal protein L37AE/L43A
MEDYPRTLRELDARFSTEEACREYLARIRWGDGFGCPACAGTDAWSTGRGLWMCTACGRQTSVTAGTIFQDTRTPLPVWFRAIWWVVSQKNGASALGLQRVLGLGSYRTAWTWLHKLRRAMVRPGREQLTGQVEVDETIVGGLETGGGRRHLGKKALVIVAAEVRGRATGRIRMRRVLDASAERLLPFVKDSVQLRSTVITDGFPSYVTLPELGYRHDRRVILGSGDSAEAVLPRVHRVASLLKRWLLGTHQGGVSRAHLDYYLDEFTFRFNRRSSRHRGKLFYRLLEQAALVEPVPYAAMVKGIRGRKPRRHHKW